MISTTTPARVSRCVEHLVADHRRGERIINELEELLDNPAPGDCWPPARAAVFSHLSRFFNERVLGHIQKEEGFLFPVLEAYLPRDIGPLAVLRGEHQELSYLFRRLLELGGALSAGSTAPTACRDFESTGRKLIQAFRDHVYKEDHILYPMVSRFLSTERDAHLLEQMEKADGTGSQAV